MKIEEFKISFARNIMKLEENLKMVTAKLFNIGFEKELVEHEETEILSPDEIVELNFSDYLSASFEWLYSIFKRSKAIEEYFCIINDYDDNENVECPKVYDQIYSLNDILNRLDRSIINTLTSLVGPTPEDNDEPKSPASIEDWLSYLNYYLTEIIILVEKIITFIYDYGDEEEQPLEKSKSKTTRHSN